MVNVEDHLSASQLWYLRHGVVSLTSSTYRRVCRPSGTVSSSVEGGCYLGNRSRPAQTWSSAVGRRVGATVR